MGLKCMTFEMARKELVVAVVSANHGARVIMGFTLSEFEVSRIPIRLIFTTTQGQDELLEASCHIIKGDTDHYDL